MAGPITLPFVTTYDGKGAKQADVSLKGLMKTQLAGAVSIGVLTQQIGKAVTAYAEDEKGQKQLALAVQNSTGASDKQVASLEGVIQKMQYQKAVADDQLRPAMSSLVRATGDVTKAQDLLNLALDISAGTGKDLETVSLALAKAQNGNIGALTRLGVSLDADAVKSKDFNAITRELGYTFQGAADAAANSAEGGFKKLNIVIGDIYEAVGKELAPTLASYANALSKLVNITLNSEQSNNKLLGGFKKLFEMVNPAGNAVKGLKTVGDILDKITGSADTATTSTRNLTRQFRAFEGQMMTAYKDGLKPTKDELKAVAAAQKEAERAAKSHADTLRNRVQTAYETITAQVKLAQQQFDSFKASLGDQVRGFVSLSDAVKTQSDAEENMTEALRNRADAYSALAKIDPTKDAEGYAQALLDVAAAETKVSEAADARSKVDYASVFLKQIEDAKSFASNLQTLISQGLGQDGLAQLINLGPIAGKAVSDDLIRGSKGMDVAGLNRELTGLRTAGEALGTTGANAFFGATLSGAQGAQGQVNNYQITVNAGLVSNPAQVGRDIIEAIKNAERISGQVFVSV